jgi:putative thioredoxin
MTFEFGSPASATEKIAVPALVISVDAVSIREYLPLSEKLPVLVIFIQDKDPASQQLGETVTAIALKAGGKILCLLIDAAKSPELAKAFEVTELPSAFALLKGQPAPLFTGDQPAQQVQMVVDRVLEVAAENQLTSELSVTDSVKEPELSETMQQAYDAMEQSDYQVALGLFEKALLEKPNDQLAEAGLAQVKLLIRLAEKDLTAIIGATAANYQEIMDKADALVATGNAEEGFFALA